MEDADQRLHQPADDFADDPEGPEWHVEAEAVVFVAREEYDQGHHRAQAHGDAAYGVGDPVPVSARILGAMLLALPHLVIGLDVHHLSGGAGMDQEEDPEGQEGEEDEAP